VFLAVDNVKPDKCRPAKSLEIASPSAPSELPASGAWDGGWGTIVVRGAGRCKSETLWLWNRRRVVIKEKENILSKQD
jgi:hypothetical protein